MAYSSFVEMDTKGFFDAVDITHGIETLVRASVYFVRSAAAVTTRRVAVQIVGDR